jgi:hypothetical protein
VRELRLRLRDVAGRIAADHYVHHDAAEVIIEAVKDVVRRPGWRKTRAHNGSAVQDHSD